MLIKSINDLLFGLNGYIAIHVFIYIDKKEEEEDVNTKSAVACYLFIQGLGKF